MKSKEFVTFLKEFNIVTFAVSVVVGNAAVAVINALVKDVVMPILAPLISNGVWQTADVHFGPVDIAYGPVIAELINFLIVGVIVYLIVRKLLKIAPPEKK